MVHGVQELVLRRAWSVVVVPRRVVGVIGALQGECGMSCVIKPVVQLRLEIPEPEVRHENDEHHKCNGFSERAEHGGYSSSFGKLLAADNLLRIDHGRARVSGQGSGVPDYRDDLDDGRRDAARSGQEAAAGEDGWQQQKKARLAHCTDVHIFLVPVWQDKVS